MDGRMCCREDPRPENVLAANLLVRAPGSRQAAYWSTTQSSFRHSSSIFSRFSLSLTTVHFLSSLQHRDLLCVNCLQHCTSCSSRRQIITKSPNHWLRCFHKVSHPLFLRSPATGRVPDFRYTEQTWRPAKAAD